MRKRGELKRGLLCTLFSWVAAVLKAGGYMGCFLGSQVLMGMMMGLLVSVQMMMAFGSVDESVFRQAMTDLSGEITMLGGLLALLLLSIWFWVRGKSPLEQVWMRDTDRSHILPAAALSMLVYGALSLAFLLLPAPWLESYAQAVEGMSETGFVMFVAIVLVAPVVEEVVFRGLVLSRLNRVMPGWPALLLSSLAFGILHGHPVWMVYAGLMGLIFGLVSLRSGSVWPAVLMHMVFNGIGYLETVLSESGRLYLWIQLLFGLLSCGAVLLTRKELIPLLRIRGLSGCSYGQPQGSDRGARSSVWGRGRDAVWDADSGADHRF